MNCTNCQHNLPEGAKFCPQCGQKVTPPDNSAADKNEESTNKILMEHRFAKWALGAESLLDK